MKGCEIIETIKTIIESFFMFVGISILKGDLYTLHTTWAIMLVCVLLFYLGILILDELYDNIIIKILFGVPIYSISIILLIYTITGILYYLIAFVKFLWNSA
jgi:hypothetical protein